MKKIASVVFLSCLTFACAGARDVSRVEPLLFLPHQREIALPIRSSEQPATACITATCDRGKAARCSHVSIRLDTVLAASISTPEERNRIIALVLGVSDYNCSAFTSHAFGRKAQLQTANTILNSVSNALAAKSEKNKSLSDMLAFIGKTGNDVLGHSSQLGSAETAIEFAIGCERKKQREKIMQRALEPIEKYTLLDALGDLAAYDETCSLQRGKELALQAAAEAAREEAVRALKVLSLPAPPPVQPPQTASNTQ